MSFYSRSPKDDKRNLPLSRDTPLRVSRQFYSPVASDIARSDIRLTPSGIRFASFRANRIPLKPLGFDITIAVAIISLFAKAKNITKKAEKERASRNFVTALLSLLFFCKFRICLTNAQGYAHTPYKNSPIRTSPIRDGFLLL